jgi:FkbM family methyltransferase
MRRFINNVKNHSNWFGYYTYKFFTSRKEPFTFNCRSGLRITVPSRMMQTYKECFFDQTYLKGFPNNVIQKNPPPTIIDVGANVGYFSLFMFSVNRAAKILAFEPMPMNYELLKKYRDENSNLNFTPVNKAVSQRNETITLNYDATDSYTTSAGIFNSEKETDTIKVPATTLAEIMDHHKLAKIDFLKLDCEGSEYSIVYNAPASVLEKISAVAIETHPGKAANENRDALAGYLSQQGFQINTYRDIIWAWRK